MSLELNSHELGGWYPDGRFRGCGWLWANMTFEARWLPKMAANQKNYLDRATRAVEIPLMVQGPTGIL